MIKISSMVMNELCDIIVNLGLVYEFIDEVTGYAERDKALFERSKELLEDSLKGARYIKDVLDKHGG